ncbi:hypothetical protein Taro_022207 [Colocasia esculenta]|uniref:Uncharacterized protein n=1 Tax=Colocasia esculenta TaxID=4460 RepID=A0A843V7Q4_COLES|nr:hypothetical protein [Colocasia esculenta]
MAASISASLPITPRVSSDPLRYTSHAHRHPFHSCPVRSPFTSAGRKGPLLTASVELSGSATGVEEWVGVLKNAAKTRRVPAAEVLAALAAIKKAKVDPSTFLDTLGGSESPGRTWMLIFTAQGRLEKGSYFPVTAIQRFDATVSSSASLHVFIPDFCMDMENCCFVGAVA